jgi:glycine cleavage system protein P-like pyridoxal-binding family
MSKKYETLDEYLDDLDKIKEAVARETEGMTSQEVVAYFNRAVKEVEELTGKKLRVRKPRKKHKTPVGSRVSIQRPGRKKRAPIRQRSI